ncbi:hypothetical protein CLPU_4c00370 [Gottschalkia purinilytica]|uniref:Uncharacterized protein n=1 Tax=Gottschalkia purinilytica TaxID=1503 RepID=A0A0L0WBZ3_GOTPU|nr:hypothetical protein [Gottschalkia purinilytica]KNF08991.1 hypothetical protein CLPU_4c00370 [Gottschalkia purinilytica]
MFRPWVGLAVALIGVIGVCAILILLAIVLQQSYKEYKEVSSKKKYVKYIFSLSPLLCVIISIYVFFISLYILVSSYDPEHLIIKDNKKMIAVVNSFFSVNVYYHSYHNLFVMGKPVLTEEYYGEGGYDPFDTEYGHDPQKTIYFDEKGNRIKVEDNQNNRDDQDDQYESNDYDKIKRETFKEELTSLEGLDVKFKSFPTKEIGYAFIASDYAMHSEEITVYKTKDSSKTWNKVSILPKSWIIHSVGFINPDIGFVSYGGIDDRGCLYRTDDGGKSWSPVQVEKYGVKIESEVLKKKSNIYPFTQAESPYIRNGKWYLQVKQPHWELDHKEGEGYALYTSDDLGLTWKFLKEVDTE